MRNIFFLGTTLFSIGMIKQKSRTENVIDKSVKIFQLCYVSPHSVRSWLKARLGVTVSVMVSVSYILLLLLVEGCFSASVVSGNGTNNRTLSRRKRLLLFPINAQVVITLAAAKLLIFKGPGGNYLISEFDMYYPLPDYRYRISSLRLGQIAMLPNEPKPNPPVPQPAPVSIPMEMDSSQTSVDDPTTHHDEPDHHYGHELTSAELQQYLKDHPETWIPPGYGKERSDQIHSIESQPSHNRTYVKPNGYDEQSWNNFHDVDDHTQAINMWHTNPTEYVERYFPRKKRSLGGGFDYLLDEEEDRFGINQHRDWEHFYHYRERRELFHTLEKEIGERFDFPMKACILRSICEVRGFMLPPGKSMIMDIARAVFSVPLKEELEDEYSAEMRNEKVNCHLLYGEKCPFSIVHLMLFGQLVWK
ncbi:uncharacterized protein LOC131681195 [Topomyia yanbarensis]|uniref:uncharacterized protein LOC131681195 n=1 Tax=Topomyia yanbarensis TaxID=2498891 RepID=UPI00273BF0B2|nr:uncharacterized protein LOC131681195 [Topomyia yanbarensis]